MDKIAVVTVHHPSLFLDFRLETRECFLDPSGEGLEMFILKEQPEEEEQEEDEEVAEPSPAAAKKGSQVTPGLCCCRT